MFLEETLECPNPSSQYGSSYAVQVFETLLNSYPVRRHPYNLHRYSLLYGNQTFEEQLRKTVDIFNRCGGMAGGLRFRNPNEFSTNNYRGTPTLSDQPLEQVGPDSFYLTVWYGDPGLTTPRRRIKKPVVSSIVLSLYNGSTYTPTAAYEIDIETGLITLDTPLNSFQSLYGGCLFDIPVIFETDMNSIDWQGAEIMSTTVNLKEVFNPEDLEDQ